MIEMTGGRLVEGQVRYVTTATGERLAGKPYRRPGKRLHLGCGLRRLPGFVHVDNRPGTDPDLIADVGNLEGVEDNSVELVYACHVLEHIPRPDVADVLREWRRVLAPGGTLRVSVPDFRMLAHMYVGDRVSLWRLRGPLFGRQDYPENTHYACYDYELLAWTLGEARFYDVRRWMPAQVHPAGYDDFSLARIDGTLISLNVEATA